MNILQYRQLPGRFVDIVKAASARGKIRVLFVCLGNICRSPAAEALMLEATAGSTLEWEIDSAGLGGWHVGQKADPRMIAHGRRRGIELTHRCRQVSESDLLDFDLVFGMDAANLDLLNEKAPTVEAQSHIFGMAMMLGAHDHIDHIPDPYYDGAQGFEFVLDLLTEATQNLADTADAISRGNY